MFGKKKADVSEQKAEPMHLETENLAMPEVRFLSDETDEELEPEAETGIDYSGAVPEIHIGSVKPKE